MLTCWLRSLVWLFNSHWHDCSTVADTIVRQLLAWLFNQDNLSCFCVENYFSMVLTVPCTTKATHNSTNNFRFVLILFSIIALQEKLIFRELFINKCKCDNNIDHDNKTQWNEFLKDLLTLSSVPARRHLLCCMKRNIEFNDFFQYLWHFKPIVMMMMVMMMMNCFCDMVVPAGTIVRAPHHLESPTHHEQNFNLRRTWVQALLYEVVQ